MTLHRKVTRRELNLYGGKGRLQLKSSQAIFSSTALFTSTCITYTSAKTGADQEEAVSRNDPLPSTHPCGIKAQQGENLREGGLEGLSSGFQVFLGEQEARETPADHGQEGCSKCSWQSCSCLWHVETPRSGDLHCALPPRTPDGRGVSAHVTAEHMKFLEEHYPSTALQLFYYLSRKELSLLISYQKPKSKLNVNKTLIKSYSYAF